MNVNRLGPFTGRQLTTIIVTLIVVLLFPLGAWAVAGSNIFVTDATSGARAKVDGNGNLQTKVSSGFVNATPAAPSQQHVSTVTFSDVGPKCKTLVTPPAGKAVVITSVHFQVRVYDAGPNTRLGDLGHSGSNGCTGGNVTLDGVSFFGNVPQSNIWQGAASQELDFPSGLAVANGHTLTVSVAGGPDDNWRVTAFGYLIAANQCTSGCL